MTVSLEEFWSSFLEKSLYISEKLYFDDMFTYAQLIPNILKSF